MLNSNLARNLNEEDKEKLLRVIELSKGLVHPPAMLIKTYEIGVKRDDGSVDVKERGRSDSFTRNQINVLTSQMLGVACNSTAAYQDSNINLKDTGGTIRGNVTYALGINASLDAYHHPIVWNDDTLGIVIGTGNTAFNEDDYELDTQISDGEAGGEMVHLPMLAPTHTWNGGSNDFTITDVRHFWNKSGGSITVNEMGWIARIFYFTAQTTSYDCLLIRDVLGAGVPIADDKVCQAKYTFTSMTIT
jgi:hypothetical protein